MSENLQAAASPRRRRWILVAAGLIVTAAAIWLLWAARSERGTDTASAGARDDMPGMGDMPGMPGMAATNGGGVRLSAADMRNFGVTFGTAERRVLQQSVRASGVIDFDETRVSAVAPKFAGYIERLYADFTGEPVRRGAPLLEIYSPELLAAQEELLLAQRLERSMEGAAIPGVPAASSDLVRAARQRLALWGIADSVVDEVLSSGRARRTLTLRSPVSGVVMEKKVLAGQAVEAGATLYTVADLSRVWVRAELREADAAAAREGAPAEVRLATYAERVYRGRVEYVYPSLREQTRTIEARIGLANPDGSLKPGMYATVHIAGAAREALTVPVSALVRTGERTLVFVDMGGGQLMAHNVAVGAIAGELAEVLSGLSAGDRVVTSAQFLIDSESNLADVMRSMLMQMNTSDMSSMPGMDGSKGADMRGMEGMNPPPVRR